MNRIIKLVAISALLSITGCAGFSEWLGKPSTQSAVRSALLVAQTEALNIGLNALSQYANGGGNVNWGAAALSAAPIALRTLESTPSADNVSDLSKTVAASIAEWRLKKKVSAESAASVVKALQTPGVTPDQAVEAVASGLDLAVAPAFQNLNDGLSK